LRESRRIGYPVTIAQMNVDHPDLSGLCYVVDDRVVIAVPAEAPSWFQVVVVCHELAHLALHHLQPSGGVARRNRAPSPLLDSAGPPQARDDLTAQERDAELLGSLLAARIEPQPASTITAEDVRLLQRHRTYLHEAVPDLAMPDLNEPSAPHDRWGIVRMVMAITDIRRGCLGYVPLSLASQVADRVGDHGLHPWQARVATDQVSLKLGMTARQTLQPPPDRHPPAWLPGDDCVDAGHRAADQLRIAEEPAMTAIIEAVRAELTVPDRR
jgi:hypothetical protein